MDTNFEPTIWAEDKLSQEAASYGECLKMKTPALKP